MPYPSDPDAGAARVRRYVLSAAALTSVVLGLELLLLPPPQVGLILPVALLGIGVAVLWGLVSFPRPRATEAVENQAPTPSLVAKPSNPSPAASTGQNRPSRARWATLTEAGADWRILSAPTSPGDETWLSWLPRERRRLGPADGTIIPGVVASSGRAGNLVAFPVRDYYGLVPPTRGAADRYFPPPRAGAPSPMPGQHLEISRDLRATTPPVEIRLPAGNSAPYTEEELDRMFPPDGGPKVRFLSEPPNRVGGGAPWPRDPPQPKRANHGEEIPLDDIVSAEIFPPTRAERALETPGPVSEVTKPVVKSGTGESHPEERPTQRPRSSRRSSNDLSLEATNPIPPHLRAAGPMIRTAARPPRRGGRDGSSSRSVCASCSKVVMNLRMSGPCPRCLRPVCDDCLREAFTAHGHGWCVDCSASAAAAA